MDIVLALPLLELLMRRSLSLIALVFAAACQGAVEPVVLPSVSATLAQAEVRVGQTLTVDVTLTNDTSRPIEVPDRMAMLEVSDAAGRVVAFGRFGMMTMQKGPDRRLEPGATATDRLLWTGEQNVSSTQEAIGTYTVRAAVLVLGGGNALAYSPPVTVVVTR
jgi:hypothetical protein